MSFAMQFRALFWPRWIAGLLALAHRTVGAAMVTCIVLAGAGGCSLISLKTPEKPLSPRDLNTRVLTRDYSNSFVAAVEKAALDIAANETDQVVLESSLRWQIAAVAESRRAATRLAPLLSLLDTWAFAAQMDAFVAEGGAGSALFGRHQSRVRALSAQLAVEATDLARRLLPAREFADYQGLVEEYVRKYPLEDLRFTRVSVEELWSRRKGTDVKLADSFGTIPEALADMTDRLEIYGETFPSQVGWQAQLLLRKSGYSQGEFNSALRQLDHRFDQLVAAANSAPALSQDLVANMRQSLFQVIDRLSTDSVASINALAVERGALAADIREERQAVALDAARIASQVIRDSGAQARALVREAVLLVIVFVTVVSGVPFAVGYLIGRQRGKRMSQH